MVIIMFTQQTITNVGELKTLLNMFPNDKPIIIDFEGNTYSPEFYNWADVEDNDISMPLAINANVISID
jgi:ABC-type microcin C transport system permease subunit YejE